MTLAPLEGDASFIGDSSGCVLMEVNCNKWRCAESCGLFWPLGLRVTMLSKLLWAYGAPASERHLPVPATPSEANLSHLSRSCWSCALRVAPVDLGRAAGTRNQHAHTRGRTDRSEGLWGLT